MRVNVAWTACCPEKAAFVRGANRRRFAWMTTLDICAHLVTWRGVQACEKVAQARRAEDGAGPPEGGRSAAWRPRLLEDRRGQQRRD